MDLHPFSNIMSPTDIWFGPGSAGRIAEACQELHLDRVLLVADRYLVSSGSIRVVTDRLDHAGITYHVLSEFHPSPAVSEVEAACDVMRDHQLQGVIGFGGGSSLDVAKAVAMLQTNPLPVNQYAGMYKVPRKSAPLILIATTAGTGSEVSIGSILKDDVTHVKLGIQSKHILADISIADPELTISMPPALTAYTGMDALTHGIEGYVSRFGNDVLRLLQREGIRLISGSLRTAVFNGKDIQARQNVMMGSMLVGWAMASSRLGACHAMAYPVEAKHTAAHGEVNAALLPAVMRFNALGDLPRFRELAELLGEPVEGLSDRQAAFRGVEAVETLSADIGIQRLGALGVTEDELPEMADIAVNYERLMVANPRKVSFEDVMQIYRDAM